LQRGKMCKNGGTPNFWQFNWKNEWKWWWTSRFTGVLVSIKWRILIHFELLELQAGLAERWTATELMQTTVANLSTSHAIHAKKEYLTKWCWTCRNRVL
jgi:hypothetical protein